MSEHQRKRARETALRVQPWKQIAAKMTPARRLWLSARYKKGLTLKSGIEGRAGRGTRRIIKLAHELMRLLSPDNNKNKEHES